MGAKVDMEEYRVVSAMEANTFAQEHGLAFIETSALSGENVDEAFMKGARTILHRIDTGMCVALPFLQWVVNIYRFDFA